jgi:uncharacterized protein YcbX
MQGEPLNETQLTERGLLGDRAFALRDKTDGKIATAKNPRKWPNLFDFSAVLLEVLAANGEKLAARITLPDGTTVDTQRADASEILSAALKRDVTLERIDQNEHSPTSTKEISEEYWLDMEGLDHRDMVTDFNLPEGTFFDTGLVRILARATLERLQELYPQGRFEVPRFRPNVVVNLTEGSKGFVENDWLGRIVTIGEGVRLKIDLNCARCVMTTLAQGNLPKDSGILRTAAQHNQVTVGVYASVLKGGKIHTGDPFRLE